MRKMGRRSIERCEVRVRAKNEESAGSARILRIITFISLGLMAAGFMDMLIQAGLPALPGPSMLSPTGFLRTPRVSSGLIAMSAGILLLAFIPSVRVVLGLKEFVHHKELLNASIAVIVLIELLISIFM